MDNASMVLNNNPSNSSGNSFSFSNFVNELPVILFISAIPATATYFISKDNKIKNAIIAAIGTSGLILIASYNISRTTQNGI